MTDKKQAKVVFNNWKEVRDSKEKEKAKLKQIRSNPQLISQMGNKKDEKKGNLGRLECYQLLMSPKAYLKNKQFVEERKEGENWQKQHCSNTYFQFLNQQVQDFGEEIGNKTKNQEILNVLVYVHMTEDEIYDIKDLIKIVYALLHEFNDVNSFIFLNQIMYNVIEKQITQIYVSRNRFMNKHGALRTLALCVKEFLPELGKCSIQNYQKPNEDDKAFQEIIKFYFTKTVPNLFADQLGPEAFIQLLDVLMFTHDLQNVFKLASFQLQTELTELNNQMEDLVKKNPKDAVFPEFLQIRCQQIIISQLKKKNLKKNFKKFFTQITSEEDIKDERIIYEKFALSFKEKLSMGVTIEQNLCGIAKSERMQYIYRAKHAFKQAQIVFNEEYTKKILDLIVKAKEKFYDYTSYYKFVANNKKSINWNSQIVDLVFLCIDGRQGEKIPSKEFEMMIILLCVLTENDIETRMNMLHMSFFQGQQKITDKDISRFLQTIELVIDPRQLNFQQGSDDFLNNLIMNRDDVNEAIYTFDEIYEIFLNNKECECIQNQLKALDQFESKNDLSYLDKYHNNNPWEGRGSSFMDEEGMLWGENDTIFTRTRRCLTCNIF